MISTRFVKLAVSGLVLGLSLTGGHPVGTSHADSSAEAKQLQIASGAAARATAALSAQNFRNAVRFAETAVEYAPRDAAYRMLLGQSYLGAGRFASAETSFSDALTLAPDNGRAALNLALMEIAQGKRDVALSTLADYRDKLAASDYGLALGLAGDIDNAVSALEAAIRTETSDAKTRQNLALAYALAGKWENARVMASQDLSSADVDARIAQWASFVRPGSSYDQVASLLGVSPAKDAGQPTRLALNAVTDNALAAVAPVAVPVPVAIAEAAVVDTPPAAAFDTVAPATAMVADVGMRQEIVQALPANYVTAAPLIRAATTAARQMIVPKATPEPGMVAAGFHQKPVRSVEAGKFVVQLGAFENAAVSRDAWKRVSSRYGLANFDPANASARVRGINFVRLSVGGFANRAEAKFVCTRIQNAGGTCFVRGIFGDAPAQWVQRGMPRLAKPVRVASR